MSELTDDDYGTALAEEPHRDVDTCRYCGKGLVDDLRDEVCDDCAARESIH